MTDLLPITIPESQVSIPPRDHIPCCRDVDVALCGRLLHGAPWAHPDDLDTCPLCDLAAEDPYFCPLYKRCKGEDVG